MTTVLLSSSLEAEQGTLSDTADIDDVLFGNIPTLEEDTSSGQLFTDLDFISPSSFNKMLDSPSSSASSTTQDERKTTTVTVSLSEEYKYKVQV